MIEKERRGRLCQEAEFLFDEFNGLKIEKLHICRFIKTTK